jgi:short-subunit dehydrogenase
MKTSLQGKVVVITGASSGFGRGAAQAFAREGCAVVLAARRGELLDQLARELQGSATAVPTDVSVAAEVEQLARTTLEQHGRIDVWINNAGVGVIGAFERVPLEEHVKVIETNLLGTLYGSYHAWQQFLVQGHGTLINVSSELGLHTSPYYAAYTAAKHGIVGLDEVLQQELQQSEREEIHVCTVLPTAHDTPFFDHVGNYTGREVQAPKPLHDPQGVIDTLVELARNPKDSKIVGGDGKVKVLLKSLVPGLAKSMGAKQMHKTQMEGTPPAEDTSGAVQEPIEKGRSVKAGRKD